MLLERLRELMAPVSVRKVWTLLTINRHWDDQHRRCSVQDERDQALGLALQEQRLDFASYGYRLERVMQQTGLSGLRKPRYVHSTDSNHGEPAYANVSENLVLETPNQCWGADLTLVRLPEGEVAPFLSVGRLLPQVHWLESSS